MKNLYIVRHSKAQEFAPDHTDFNRCLAPSGIEKATRIAKQLSESFREPDLILSSPACRALETAKIFARALKYSEKDIRQLDPLYHFGGINRALNIIGEVTPEIDTLMLFGHNPTFTALSWDLCDEFRQAMPTSAVVGLEFEFDNWQDIHLNKGKLISFLTRKNLNQ